MEPPQPATVLLITSVASTCSLSAAIGSRSQRSTSTRPAVCTTTSGRSANRKRLRVSRSRRSNYRLWLGGYSSRSPLSDCWPQLRRRPDRRALSGSNCLVPVGARLQPDDTPEYSVPVSLLCPPATPSTRTTPPPVCRRGAAK